MLEVTQHIHDAVQLVRIRIQHPQVRRGDDLLQLARLDVPDLDKLGVECYHVGIYKGKVCWRAGPVDNPVRPCSAAEFIHIESKLYSQQSKKKIILDMMRQCILSRKKCENKRDSTRTIVTEEEIGF